MKQVWQRLREQSKTVNKALQTALFAGLLLGLPAKILAYSLTFDPGNILKTSSKLGSKDPAFIVFSVVNTALIFLGTITLVTIIIAGFMWLFANGEEEKIKKAKDLLKGAVIGLVIVMSSYGLAQYVFKAIQVATTG